MKTQNKILLSLLLFFSCVINNGQTNSVQILVNHIGYELNGPKHAIIQSTEKLDFNEFLVIDYNTGKEVFKGKTVYQGTVSKWKNWIYHTMDFDNLKSEGAFYITCKTGDNIFCSYPFSIEKNIILKNTVSDVIYYFKGQRCSGLLDKADSNIQFDGNETKTINAHGGWYDATGDYGKHLSHLSNSTFFNPQQLSFTVWSLFKSYDALKSREDVNYNQYLRRLIDEAMYGADYLVRIKNPDGSFYRSIRGPGSNKAPEDRRISNSMGGFVEARNAKGIDASNSKFLKIFNEHSYEVGFRAGAGIAIAALAVASVYNVSGDFSSKEYLNAAESAFTFLEENNIHFTNDGEENIVDDYCALIAASELYKTTKKKLYKISAGKRAQNLLERLITSDKFKNYWRADKKDRPFFHAADAGMPVVSLLTYYNIADGNEKKKIAEAVKKSLLFELELIKEVVNPFRYARQYVQNIEGARYTSFFFPHNTETTPWWQGENARLASIATAARMAAKIFDEKELSEKLESHAVNQINWILGLNPFDSCMLQGKGRNNPWYMWYNTYQYTNAPGGIVNGITGGYKDEDDIDYQLFYADTAKDDDWRWGEQWLPHASWFLMAVSLNSN